MLGRLQHPRHLGQEGLTRRAQHLGLDRAREVEAAALEPVARVGGNRRGFAGDDRPVDIGAAPPDPHVDRHPVARQDGKGHAGTDLVEWQIASAAVRLDHGAAAGGEAREPGNGAAGALAHQRVEVAADEQEEQQRHRRVEEDVLAAADPSNRLRPSVRSTPSEIGTSMLSRPARKPATAEAKNGWPA